MSKCSTCPLHPDYRFKTHCRIDSCKYYTEKTQRKCMGLDTTLTATEKGTTTDAELRFLKLPDKSKREVCSIRREAQDRVHMVITLHRMLTIIREKYPRDVFAEENPVTEKISEHELFNDPDLGMESWMIEHLFCPDLIKQVSDNKSGNPKIHLLFDVSDKELEQYYPPKETSNV